MFSSTYIGNSLKIYYTKNSYSMNYLHSEALKRDDSFCGSIVQMGYYPFLNSPFYDSSTANFLMFSFTISDSISPLWTLCETVFYLRGNAFIVIQSVAAVNMPPPPLLLFWPCVPKESSLIWWSTGAMKCENNLEMWTLVWLLNESHVYRKALNTLLWVWGCYQSFSCLRHDIKYLWSPKESCIILHCNFKMFVFCFGGSLLNNP